MSPVGELELVQQLSVPSGAILNTAPMPSLPPTKVVP